MRLLHDRIFQHDSSLAPDSETPQKPLPSPGRSHFVGRSAPVPGEAGDCNRGGSELRTRSTPVAARCGSPEVRSGRAVWGGIPLALALVFLAPAVAKSQVSLFDPRFDDIRRASVVWDNRLGPERQVVDVVCLVPDIPTFLEVIGTWDDHHYFPVLIDDVEYTLKFLRAFRPARIVRYPSKVAGVAPEALWDRAVGAVGRSWSNQTTPASQVPRGDVASKALGPLPPGVVLSSPEAANLAGGVALAAGRFQPLLRYRPTGKSFVSVANWEDARKMVMEVETLVAEHVGKYDALGDDCDFLTLAGDYPYRYTADPGVLAFDDLLARSPRDMRRWAFVGRLLGDPTQSVYRAMCSLFLRPRSALMFNAYNQKSAPWTDYAMTTAATKLVRVLPVTHQSGANTGVGGWHQVFDPINRFGLVMLNSHGNPSIFNLFDAPAQTADVPETEPTAVLMIHSYSSVTPDDPGTIAGRWLANGAFAYFGAMEEPFLQSFRAPGVSVSFLAENLPLVTAVRQAIGEPFGKPWRLLYLGDPLYRLKPLGVAPDRLTSWGPIESWPAYGEYRQPEPDASAEVRLNWALKTAIFQFQRTLMPQQNVDLSQALLAITRNDLEPRLRPILDDLLVDALLHANRQPELIDRLTRIPPEERTPNIKRHLETLQMAALHKAMATRDIRQALALWTEVIRAVGSPDFTRIFTERVARLADSPVRLADWRSRLRSAVRGANVDHANVAVIEAELKRVEGLLDPSRKKP